MHLVKCRDAYRLPLYVLTIKSSDRSGEGRSEHVSLLGTPVYWFSVNRTLGMKNIVVEVTGQAVARRSMFGERLALAAWRSSARRSLASASFLSLLAQMASCLSARRSAGAM